jgi:hypothetical protein
MNGTSAPHRHAVNPTITASSKERKEKADRFRQIADGYRKLKKLRRAGLWDTATDAFETARLWD